jgi:hypothetical protein
MNLEQELQEIKRRFFKKFGHGQAGNRRVVYKISDKFVVKVPLNQDGIDHNKEERKIYLSSTKDNCRYARCYLFHDKDTSNLVPLLIMDIVAPVQDDERQRLPEWTLSIDLQQVGYNKRGELVAFDYATFVSKPNLPD